MPEPLSCTSCATEIPAGARFCVKCGTAAPVPAAEAPTVVPPGGVAQSAPTQQVPTDPTWNQPPPAAVPGQVQPTAPSGYPQTPPVAAAPAAPVADYRYGYQDPATAWQQPGAPVAPVAPARKVKPPKAKGSGRTVVAGLLGFLGALTLAIATFLPWADIDQFRSISGAVVTGWDGLTSGVQDGLPFAMVALVGGAVAASMLSGRSSMVQKLLLVLAGVIGLGMSIFEISSNMVDVEDINDINQSLGLPEGASLGYGLWVALAGSIMMLLAGLLAKRTKAPSATDPAASPVGPQGPPATFGDPRAVGAVGSAPA